MELNKTDECVLFVVVVTTGVALYHFMHELVALDERPETEDNNKAPISIGLYNIKDFSHSNWNLFFCFLLFSVYLHFPVSILWLPVRCGGIFFGKSHISKFCTVKEIDSISFSSSLSLF